MLTTTARITRIDGGRNGRHYQVEGFPEPFPSVTTVLGIINKPALVPWARNMALESVRETLYEHLAASDGTIDDPEWVENVIEQARRRLDQLRDQAADFGTAAHILIEQIIQTCCDYADTLLQRNETGDRERAMSLLDESLAISSELGMRPARHAAIDGAGAVQA